MPNTRNLLLAGAALAAATFAGTLLVPDYYDQGWLGLVSTIAVGLVATFIDARWGRAEQPLFVAILAVLPWAFALGGLAYLGFFFVPLEIAATAFVFRRFTQLRGFKLIAVAIIVRAVAFLPIVLLTIAR